MVSKFLTVLRAEKAGGGNWRLLHPLVYKSEIANTIFVVPEGFETDYASVPRIPLAFLLTGDTAHEAAVLHDFLYREQLVDRSLADAVFREAMIATGEPTWRVWLMWLGVRIGGSPIWNNAEA